jgi:hypothetical protein
VFDSRFLLSTEIYLSYFVFCLELFASTMLMFVFYRLLSMLFRRLFLCDAYGFTLDKKLRAIWVSFYWNFFAKISFKLFDYCFTLYFWMRYT